MDFGFRGPRIIAEIRQSRADIICLQEVDRVSDFYREQFSAFGYDLIFYGRPGDLSEEGIAIAYNLEKFTLLEKEEIDFDVLSSLYKSGKFKRAN